MSRKEQKCPWCDEHVQNMPPDGVSMCPVHGVVEAEPPVYFEDE